MSFELMGTLAVLLVGVVLFLSERLRPDVVALATVAVLAGMGILSAQESFSGFSSPAVITLISVFILAEGLNRTGVADLAARFLLHLAGQRESRLVGLVMAVGAALSLFMNNIAAAAVLLPAAGWAARKAGISSSRVMMPLAFATILGGMATLLTTMNIIVGSVLENSGLEGFGLLDFLPVGGPMMVVGILYMSFWGRHRLPSGADREEALQAMRRETDLLDVYRMGEFFFRARIPAHSYLIGKTLALSTFREDFGLNVVALEEKDGLMSHIQPDTVFQEGDVLVLEGDVEHFKRRDRQPYLEILPGPSIAELNTQISSTVFAEVMLSPRSSLIGQTLVDVMFRQRYGMVVLAIWRGGQPIRQGMGEMRLVLGDALLLQGPKDRLKLLELDPDLILLSMMREVPRVRGLGIVALTILLATLAAVLFTSIPMAQLMLSGAVLMLIVGAVNMEQAYRAIDWRGIFLVAGMLPLALALTHSGAAQLASGLFVSLFGGMSPIIMILVMFGLSALLTQALNGAAVAAIMAPIAISVSLASGIPAQALGMAVALGSSMAFLTPLGHPVNTLVMGAGGYRFRDYRRVGWPLFVILTLVAVAGLTLRWNLLRF